MNEVEFINTQTHIVDNPLFLTTKHRRSHPQRISPSPESLPNNQFSSVDTKSHLLLSSGNSHSLPIRSPMTHTHPTDHQHIHFLDNADSDNNSLNNSPPSNSINQQTSSTITDLDPVERKRQSALAKVEAKLDKAQRLYQSAQQSVEQNISEFLRVTTLPGILHESKTTNAAYEKRIRTLQETKKELEKKISNYQSDIARIKSGDIPQHCTSSKDILNNIKNKVSTGTSKPRSSTVISTTATNEHPITSHRLEPDNHQHPHHNQLNIPSVSTSHTADITRSSPSNSISNEFGHSQFYIDSTFEHVYDGEKSNRKYEGSSPADLSAIHDIDKSPLSKRRLTDDSNLDFNDRISDHSNDDRFISYNTSKRSTMISTDSHQLLAKVDLMQKTVDRYETKSAEMQKHLDLLAQISNTQQEQNERLKNDVTDLMDLHQTEMSTMKTDLRKLEEKLLYNFNEYWSEMVEKLDKLDTRTTKVEQTLTHSLETEENTHRVISKLVNILLTVFAIILLLLSTIKNLVQSRVHAVILLILVFVWVSIHYLPENYFQSSFLRGFANIYKRSA